ncbi:MAG: cupredoxin domain-containing protein [Saccharofermentanales bacterium]
MKIRMLSLLTILLAASIIVAGCQNISPEPQITESVSEADVVVVLTAVNYSYSKDTMTVKKGQKVRIELTVTQGTHDWVVDEFNASTDKVGANQTTFVEFVPDRSGEFEFYCSVGNHRAMGMIGKLIVQD